MSCLQQVVWVVLIACCFANGYSTVGHFQDQNLFLASNRTRTAAAVVGTRAFIAGGLYGSSNLASIEIVSYSSGSVSVLPDTASGQLHHARHDHVGVSIIGKAAFIGGITTQPAEATTVELVDFGSITQGTDLLETARSLFAVAATSTHVAVAGGLSGGGSAIGSIEVFRKDYMTKVTLSLAIAPRYYLSGLAVGNRFFFAGGKNAGQLFTTVNVLLADSGNFNWQPDINLPGPGRYAMGAASGGNYLIFAGGAMSDDLLNSASFINRVDIYDLGVPQWNSATNLLTPKRDVTIAVVGLRAYIAGGVAVNSVYQSDVEVYNLQTGQRVAVYELREPRSRMAGFTIDSLVMFAGGSTSGSRQSSILDVFDGCLLVTCPLTGTTGVSSTTAALTTASSPTTASSSPTTGSPTTASPTNTVTTASSGGTVTTGIPAQTVSTTMPTEETASLPTQDTTMSSETTSLIQDDSSGSGANILPIIIGALAGVIFLLIVIGLLAFLYSRRKRNARNDNGNVGGTSLELAAYPIITDLEIKEKLGSGNFSEVYKGVWQGTTLVAAKKLKNSNQFEEFLSEATMLAKLSRHPHLVQFLGIFHDSAHGGQKYIVTEYLSKGSLDVLVQQEKQSLTLSDLTEMAKHAAAGMAYLETQKIVHRDLALRNLLVTTQGDRAKYLVKVADLGLSRQMEKNYYKTEDKTLPVKWSSPEVLEYGHFSTKSDVFSFGVVLWELFSYGMMPYRGLGNAEVIDKVCSGYRMPAPPNCPTEISELMVQCWAADPDQRPSFKQLFDTLSAIGAQYRQAECANNPDNAGHVASTNPVSNNEAGFYNTPTTTHYNYHSR